MFKLSEVWIVYISFLLDRVVGRMIDEDRNFARYYMSLIVKDMRSLHVRRGIPEKTAESAGADGNSLIDSEDELEN